jgi:hypothetical protein
MADDKEFEQTIKLMQRLKWFCASMPDTRAGLVDWAQHADTEHLRLGKDVYSTSFLHTLECVSQLHAAIVGRN